MTKNSQTITLVGAGPNGLLLAIGLVQRGFKAEIYERHPDMRRVRMSAGRSINLALSTRGIHALKKIGLWDAMRAIIIPMKGRMMHSVAGETTFQAYGRTPDEVIHSISRAELNIALMNAAEAQGVRIHFESRCTGIDLQTGTLTLRREEASQEAKEETKVETGIVIGCDGSASAIRAEMAKRPGFDLSQQRLDYGYKELTIPASADGKHQLEIHALHIWPRGSYMLIALPNTDGTFASILFLPFNGPDSFATLTAPDEVGGFFRSRFPDALSLMPQLAENYFANPTGSMVTIKCSPWHSEGNTLLLGDAAHAIVPFFGQGLNCGFEDCASLLDLVDRNGLDRHSPNWQEVFPEFEKARKINADAIADMALENFVEMRDRVADPRFLFRKKVELALEAKFPGVFVPKYAMVTFHPRVPYSIALSRGLVQDKILSQLCDPIERLDDLDWKKAAELIGELLTPLEQAA